jgi:N-methylhydantoinase B
MTQFDVVNLGILWDRLVSIANEMVLSLVRTSFSSNVREAYDLSCVLFDSQGNSLSQGSYSVPTFTGTAPPTLRHMLAVFPPETLEPGDVIVTNDPWMGTGHLFDINIMRPVFHEGRHVGYTMSITHLPDIGGMGFSATTTEIYAEGLRLPVMKLMRAGQLNEELLDLIRINVRAKEQVIGDIMANISCNVVGGRMLVEFMTEYGITELAPLSQAIRAQTERVMREKMAEIPDGVYRNEIQIEGMDRPITLACAATISGDSAHIDFAGTGPAVRAAINAPLCYTRALSFYPFKCITIPHLPNNEGAVAPVSISAPEGCVLNAVAPSATGGRHTVGHFIVPLIFGALAEAVPDKVQADVGMTNSVNFIGQHQDGRNFAGLFFLAGGFGALEGLDGASTTPAPSNMSNVSTEVWEEMTSMTIESRELLTDSGGPGQYRGGLGQRVVMRNDTGRPVAAACFGQRTEFPARGLHGGMTGRLREVLINGEKVHPKGTYLLAPGDTLTTLEAGGGGFGDPRVRVLAALTEDARNGFVSPDSARRNYGAEIDPETGEARRP